MRMTFTVSKTHCSKQSFLYLCGHVKQPPLVACHDFWIRMLHLSKIASVLLTFILLVLKLFYLLASPDRPIQRQRLPQGRGFSLIDYVWLIIIIIITITITSNNNQYLYRVNHFSCATAINMGPVK